MAILPRYKRLKRRDWKDPFSWFNWFHTRNNPDPVFLYRPESGRVGMAGFTATRADSTTCARYRDSSGIWQTAAANVLRDGHYHYDANAGQSYRTLLREGASTNSALGACSFGDATYWANATDWTLAAATSCISGTTAYRHTNLGVSARIRVQNVGVFVNGQTDCFSAIVENVSATTTLMDIRDGGSGGTVCARVTFTWATGAAALTAGSGTVGAIPLGTGPAGGALYRIYVTFTGTAAGTGAAGNVRTMQWYPTGATINTDVVIVHHAQFEAATSYPSSPIVTVAGAVTRAADLISVAWPYAPQAMTVYMDAYDLGMLSGGYDSAWNIGGSLAGADKYIGLWCNPAGTLVLEYNNAGTNKRSQRTLGSFGDRIETRSILTSTGTDKLGLAINAAAETVSSETSALALPASWTNATLTIGTEKGAGANYPANLAIRSIAIVLGSEQTMAQMRHIVRQ